MFLFWRKKDDPETAGRKALLEYLKNLEKQNLIRWTSDNWEGAKELSYVTVSGQFQDLEINLTYSKPGFLIHYNGSRFEGATFKSMTVSLKGNGILNLDSQTASMHWFWGLDPRVTYLMSQAERAMRRAQDAKSRSEHLDKSVKAEQDAKEILRNIPAKHASC